MECVEGALKSGFGPEKEGIEEAGGVSVDDFFVDDLLDLSSGGIEDGFAGEVEDDDKEEEEEEERQLEQDNKPSSGSVSPPNHDKDNQLDPSLNTFSVKDGFGSVPGSELSVPADDLADLEWLSHFVEDSFSEYSLAFSGEQAPRKPAENRSEPGILVSTNPCFSTPVQTKARSKRARTGGRVWSLGSHRTETSSSSSSTSSSPGQTAESFFGKSPAKRRKRPPTVSSGGAAPAPRRCSHCLVQKTPQWRAGPLGAKTLCNACGVRYKSGRLLPEYRPACSPTFSGDIHSNNHRKVLEMRRKKEVDSGLAPPVQSF